MCKLDKTVVVHGSFSSFSAIWSHNLSSVQAQICRLFTPVTCLWPPLAGGSLPRKDVQVFPAPFTARPSPEKLSPAAWLPDHLCFSRLPYAPKIFLPLPLLGKAVHSRVCVWLPAFLVIAAESLLPSQRARRPLNQVLPNVEYHFKLTTLHTLKYIFQVTKEKGVDANKVTK